MPNDDRDQLAEWMEEFFEDKDSLIDWVVYYALQDQQVGILLEQARDTEREVEVEEEEAGILKSKTDENK